MRNPLDRYDSPDWMTLALLEQHPDIGGGWCIDPCSGDGRMAELLRPRFQTLHTNDLDPAVAADTHLDARGDALYQASAPDWIITNPPFIHAAAIVLAALRAARVGVAMLLRCTFLEPVKRRAWLAEQPPTHQISLPRHRWKGAKHGTDSVPVWWFLWKKNHQPTVVVVTKAHVLKLRQGVLAQGEGRAAQLALAGVAQ